MVTQKILPALRQMQQFEKIMDSSFETFVLLDVHISQLALIRREAKRRDKKIFIHADLVHGLKTDDFAADFLLHDIRPDGIISTRSNIILKAKKKDIIAIQRMFLLDSMALEKSYSLIRQTKPDYIEVLPGIIPEVITEVKETTNIPVISGGLINTEEQVKAALRAGAHAVTTSNESLWKINL
ncbi:glycerol-3-phosphate responsive antiterminator [Savagea faecisuis]|uniref:Glycerol uptake operon antiterminator regulatory protein n=1 Tax=Savagea faecisuis TaxID=1274803 RepID=A0ABW3GSR5_9BACL